MDPASQPLFFVGAIVGPAGWLRFFIGAAVGVAGLCCMGLAIGGVVSTGREVAIGFFELSL